jgi:hypothetical protein
MKRKEKTELIAKTILRLYYENICNAYVNDFCEKQDMTWEGWVGDQVGSIAECSDFYFDFRDIITDIDTGQPKGLIIDWYYDNLEGERYINYNSYIGGLRVKDLPVEDVETLAKDYAEKWSSKRRADKYIRDAFIEGYLLAQAPKTKAIYHQLMKEKEEIISSPVRFTGVSDEKIKKVFEKYFDPYQSEY